MDYIKIGEIVNTHGIKGEVRIISSFKYKDVIFKKDFIFYVGKAKEKLVASNYRKHKDFDMLKFYDIDNINDVLAYKGELIYINREDLSEEIILNEDLIGYEVYITDKLIGKVTSIINNNAHDILVVENDKTRNLIPYISEFIVKIDSKNSKIEIEHIEGLVHED